MTRTLVLLVACTGAALLADTAAAQNFVGRPSGGYYPNATTRYHYTTPRVTTGGYRSYGNSYNGYSGYGYSSYGYSYGGYIPGYAPGYRGNAYSNRGYGRRW